MPTHAVLLGSLVALALASSQDASPIAPASAPPPTPAATGTKRVEGTSSWKEIDAAAIGPIRPLLVDRPELRVAAGAHVAVDPVAVGQPGAIVTLSSAPYCAFLSFRAGRVELRSIQRSNRVVSEPMTVFALRTPPVMFDEGPDGKSVLFRADLDSPILLVDVPTGAIRTTLDSTTAGPGKVMVLDERSFAVISPSGSLRRFSGSDGALLGETQLPPSFPIAAGRGHVVGQMHMDPPTASGTPLERRMIVASFDAVTGKESGRADLPAGPVAWSLNSGTICVGEVTTGWSAIRTLDIVTMEERPRVLLSPNVSSLRLEMSADGRFLYFQEYIAQPIIAWEVATGTAKAVFGPELGGFLRFDVSNDGKTLGGIVGPWVKGTLSPDAFEWTDLESVPQLKAPADATR
ncbi:MAG: hypothetical protein JNL80_00145 [Phycisphaerae bacterium]|jgi:hypothetical protein|nr:hypothetical protein [Phycisphaerae bacterium]